VLLEVIERVRRRALCANCAGVDLHAGLIDYRKAGFDTIFNGASLFVCLKHQILAMGSMRGAMIIIASAPEAIADAILFLCSSSASMNADGSSP
jgi:hypothetical protein